MPQAHGTFGVHGCLPADARDVLDMADEYRAELCGCYQQRHQRTIDLRNERFPDLFAALVEYEAAGARIGEIEATIKSYHSDTRDRNALLVTQRLALAAARSRRADALESVREQRAGWNAVLAAWRLYFSSRLDWKQVKSLTKRRAAYAEIDYEPTVALLATLATDWGVSHPGNASPFDPAAIDRAAMAAFGRLDLERDLAERDVSAKYQALGLHSSIRGEIDEASQPKRGASGPGMRYAYGRRLDIRPWEKLTINFVGGLSVAAALEGTSQFRLTDLGRGYFGVEQQIGTAASPRMISYRVRIHVPFAKDAVLQRWSLCVRRETVVLKNKQGEVREVATDRAVVVPIIKDSRAKTTGSGTLQATIDVRQTPGGLQVAEFFGPHICEPLILPDWLLDRWSDAKAAIAAADTEANECLAAVSNRPATNRRQGVEALRDYVAANADDYAAAVLSGLIADVSRHRRRIKRATRTIEKIYETVVSRVCRLHGELSLVKRDWSRKKRYDTRDLLRQDAAARSTRELLFLASPGKLQALLLGYGLLASGEVVEDFQATARKTDVFNSYVRSIGCSPEAIEARNRVRSQNESLAIAGE